MVTILWEGDRMVEFERKLLNLFRGMNGLFSCINWYLNRLTILKRSFGCMQLLFIDLSSNRFHTCKPNTTCINPTALTGNKVGLRDACIDFGLNHANWDIGCIGFDSFVVLLNRCVKDALSLFEIFLVFKLCGIRDVFKLFITSCSHIIIIFRHKIKYISTMTLNVTAYFNHFIMLTIICIQNNQPLSHFFLPFEASFFSFFFLYSSSLLAYLSNSAAAIFSSSTFIVSLASSKLPNIWSNSALLIYEKSCPSALSSS